jgi:hypothetical protein
VLEIGRINPEISLPEARIGGTQTEISPRGINRRRRLVGGERGVHYPDEEIQTCAKPGIRIILISRNAQ